VDCCKDAMPRLYNPQRTLLFHWDGTVLPRIWLPMVVSTVFTFVSFCLVASFGLWVETEHVWAIPGAVFPVRRFT
jgi:hypothetical protein